MANQLSGLRDPRFLTWRLPWFVLSLLLGTLAIAGGMLQPPKPDPFVPISESFLGWLRYPTERNSQLRLPFISTNLRSVGLSLDGRTAVVVGDDGTVLKSADRGDNWTQHSGVTPHHLSSITVSPDGQTGIMTVWDGSAILKTTDGGQTWDVGVSSTPPQLTSVAMSLDGRIALAVGEGGSILKTTDGGNTWTDHISGTSEALRSVAISADGGTALAVGLGGTIIKSVDGGDNWESRESRISEHLSSVAISADGDTALAVGNAGTILKWVNGDDNWEPRESRTTEELRSVAISADGRTALAVGNNGTVRKSVDGGDNWEPNASGTLELLLSVAISADGETALAVGNAGTILRTTNGGGKWQPRTSGASGFLNSVAFGSDSGMALAVGRDGTILKTLDGGSTWTPRTSGTLQPLFSVAINASGGIGFAVGDEGTILKSEDGGDSWMSLPKLATRRLFSVAINSDGSRALVVGVDGTIFRTTDGGQNWVTQPLSGPASILTVAMSSDGSTALAVGGDSIIKSVDGGDTWAMRPSSLPASYFSVAISRDGNTALVAGRGGRIFKSVDGGESWAVVPSGTSETRKELRSVTIGPGGDTALAVGSGGTVLMSGNGGDSWETGEVGVTEYLESVAISADGSTALAVGWGAILLGRIGIDQDEIVTWRQLEAKRDHWTYPALWTGIFLILALLALRLAFRSAPSSEDGVSIADHLVSDGPIMASDSDSLQRQYIADTLSHFLLNKNTEPPMTVAITGDWGEGKSSLMHLVRANLKKRKTRTVWFNAWHHQKEQHLFAALLHAVRDQAVPPLLTFHGIAFRLRLFVSRAPIHWVWTTVVLASPIALLLLGLFLVEGVLDLECRNAFSELLAPPNVINRISRLWDPNNTHVPNVDGLLNDCRLAETHPLISLLSGLGSFVVAITILSQGLVATLKRSGVNPGRLMAATTGPFHVTTFGNQLGFRHRFAEAFNEVAEALRPKSLVVLIDDLDRCRPNQVVEVLEAVNFLVSAGRCYILMGIAPEQVMHCVGLGFREIAAEMAMLDKDGQAIPLDAGAQAGIRAHRARREFARNYLEKLINIEVPIPKLTDGEANRLAVLVKPNRGPQRFVGALRVARSLVTALLALVMGIYVLEPLSQVGLAVYQRTAPSGDRLSTVGNEIPPSNQQQRPATVPETASSQSLTSVGGDGSGQSKLGGNGGNSAFVAGADVGAPWWIPFSAGFFGLTVMFLVVSYVRRQLDAVVEDSAVFTKALYVWHPLVRARTNSPRHMKRFINRVRYLAMATRSEGNTRRPKESLIVALTALQWINKEITVEDSRRVLTDIFRGSCNVATAIDTWQCMKTLERTEIELIERAFVDHHNEFGAEELSEETLEQFRKMASGIVAR